tara:strand:+ start:832 stop:1089 length:258 start_codon:yes stop_codon:yes gene_type:complete
MATIKNVRQILPSAVGGQVEVVYDEGECKYIYPHDTDAYAEVQTWVDAGNTVISYVEPTFDANGIITNGDVFKTTPEFITQSRTS